MTDAPQHAHHFTPGHPCDAPTLPEALSPAGSSAHSEHSDPFDRVIPHQVTGDYGIPLPVSISAAVWADAVAWSQEQATRDKRKLARQTEAARLAELLTATRYALADTPWNSDAVDYRIHRVPPTGPVARALPVTMRVQISNSPGHGPVFAVSHAHAELNARSDHWSVAGDAPWTPTFLAPSWEMDALGQFWPLVTSDVLHQVLAQANYEVLPRWDRRSVDAIPSPAWPGAHGVRLYVQGWPNLWSLQPLGWRFIMRSPYPAA